MTTSKEISNDTIFQNFGRSCPRLPRVSCIGYDNNTSYELFSIAMDEDDEYMDDIHYMFNQFKDCIESNEPCIDESKNKINNIIRIDVIWSDDIIDDTFFTWSKNI